MNAVRDKWDYLDRLKLAIEDSHKCSALFLRTHLVDETVGEKTAWVGDVEVFALTRHPKAKFCYAWSRRKEKKDEGEQFVIVLEIPPINSPQAAVRSRITLDSQKEKGRTP